jgi:homoserine O-acetyltransferase
MNQRIRTPAIVLGLLSGAMLPGAAPAQTGAQTVVAAGERVSDRGAAATAVAQRKVTYANYRFKSGETLEHLHIHYATMGAPHRNDAGEIDNAVLVLHWTGASGASLLTPDYVDALFAAGKPLDANRYYLIFPDNVGHGKSSKPSDGLRAKFPQYGYGDIVDIQHKLVAETLGIRRLHAILGMSMGGMNAWQWAEKCPDKVKGIMPVVSFPTAISGRNLLWRTIVTRSIRNDPTWHGGNYTQQPTSFKAGYLVVRFMIDSVARLQSQVPDSKGADDWIDTVLNQGVGTDANDMLFSLESSRDYDPEAGLGLIKAKVYALNFSDDEFNPDQLGILQVQMKRVTDGRYVVQQGTNKTPGHLTMMFPRIWAGHVGTFMRSLE